MKLWCGAGMVVLLLLMSSTLLAAPAQAQGEIRTEILEPYANGYGNEWTVTGAGSAWEAVKHRTKTSSSVSAKAKGKLQSVTLGKEGAEWRYKSGWKLKRIVYKYISATPKSGAADMGSVGTLETENLPTSEATESFSPSASYLKYQQADWERGGPGWYPFEVYFEQLKKETTASDVYAVWAEVEVEAPSVQPAGVAVGWGRNYPHDVLDIGYESNYEVSPITLAGPSDITQMAIADDTSFALLANGTVKAWGGGGGAGGKGLLGDDSHKDSSTPVAVDEELADGEVREMTGVQAIAASGVHALALLSNGKVMTWGGAEFGQRGNGESGFYEETVEGHKQKGAHAIAPRDVAVEVPGLSGVVSIASGGADDYAVLTNGTVEAWGLNLKGMLGNGDTPGPETCVGETELKGAACSTRPAPVCALGATAPCTSERGNVLGGVADVSAGAETGTREGAAYAVSDGAPVAWGNNNHGQLGDDSTEASAVPVQVDMKLLEKEKAIREGESVSAVAGGDTFALALLSDGEVIAWGSGTDGNLGSGPLEECSKNAPKCSKTPKLVSGLKEVSKIAAGLSFSLALSNGTLYAFGDNEHGQLGIGNTTNTDVPTPVTGISHVGSMVAGNGPKAGEAHSFALLESGSGPPPLLTIKPGPLTLEISWIFSSSEDKIRWKRDQTVAEEAKEEKIEEDEEALEAAKSEGATEEANSLEAEIAQLKKELKEEEEEKSKPSKTVTRTGAEAESCSAATPCHYLIDEYLEEPLTSEAYAVTVRSVGEFDRTIVGTPLKEE